MSDLDTTELKLRTTPTGGVSGEHSPYYRRLLSAGYKGYLQGTLGGAGYYGLLGLAIGTAVAIPAMFIFPPLGTAALMLIPALGGAGVLKGADTFGNIGTVAAINAESADLAEQRRYLLDRYYDLPEGPEGDKQAAIIKQELQAQTNTERPHQMFHWKTVAVCAAIGALLALTFLTPMGFGLLGGGGPLLHILGGAGLAAEGGALAGASTTITTVMLTALGTAIGALAGATIGVDRHYVRSWFDGSEKLLNDDSHVTEALRARSQQVDRIRAAAAMDAQTRQGLARHGEVHLEEPLVASLATSDPAKAAPVASLDTPDTKIHSAELQSRMADIQHAMQIPAL